MESERTLAKLEEMEQLNAKLLEYVASERKSVETERALARLAEMEQLNAKLLERVASNRSRRKEHTPWQVQVYFGPGTTPDNR